MLKKLKQKRLYIGGNDDIPEAAQNKHVGRRLANKAASSAICTLQNIHFRLILSHIIL